MTAHRAFLEELYAVGVAGAHAGPLVEDALAQLHEGGTTPGRVAIIAIGKAAPAMAEAAVESLVRRGTRLRGGIIIGSAPGPAPHPAIARVAADHPVPRAGSRRAAAMLADAVARARSDADTALVLLSGGASSLAGSPARGIGKHTLTALNDALLRSG